MASPGKPTGGKVELGAYSIDLLDEKGRGTFGTVYMGQHRKTKMVVAVKKMQVTLLCSFFQIVY